MKDGALSLPAAVAGRRYRVQAASCCSAATAFPPLIRPATAAVPETYTRFLANAIRKEFQLFGVPVRLYVRAPENPYKNRRNHSSGAKKPALSKERRSKLRLARWMANSGAKAGRRSGPATGAAQPAAAPARAEGGGDRVDKRQALPLPAVPRGGIKVKAGQRRAVQHKQQAQRRDKRSGSDARSTTAGARGGARVAASARR